MAGASHPEGKPWSAEHYAALRPDSVLDVGPGQGIYAQQFRPLHRAHWTALEIHEPYVQRFGLDQLYDTVIIGDALTDWPIGRFGLVILGDVVEHVPAPEGRRMLWHAMASADAVLLSIPLGVYEQGSIDGNDHEEHKATWWHDDVIAVLGDRCEYWIGTTVGCYWWVSRSIGR